VGARRHSMSVVQSYCDIHVAAQKFGILFFGDKREIFMKVNFYATLRAIVGQKSIDVDFHPNITAMELVEKVVKIYPALDPELLDTERRFHRHMKFFINGREALYLENKMNTVIQPEDKVDIFPPVGGG
jgi:molybdopterin synthase sulfur carrier subunit